ncbi:MAG: 16S rRNA (adenine(1518)-N(6)/adenine(1519)-N(6))-dimethyltransferase RsmA [Alphaproteobacteria bacterium]|nr:MAG: 16S rRNA (adenine(1518)-N(6)/adenine(1519)-N(6))-dimethyltransferase RsmA [Alphaproteobacteria bacterium]
MADLPPLREVIRTAGLEADKRLGQHFLLDLNLTARIARAAGPLDHGTTIEVGPGPGGLTRALLMTGAAKVVAIEKDRRMVAALAPLITAAAGRLEVVEADALTIDPATLGPPPHRIVANLPYNVGTAMLVGWLQRMPQWESLTLMFQREVALRIVAPPRGEEFGRLAVLAQSVATARLLFDIARTAFVPPPKVTSAVVRLEPKPALDAGFLKALEAVTGAAFGQRRKMLRQSLKSLGVDVESLLAAVSIEATRRAETLEIAEFHALAAQLRQMRAG